MADDEPEPDAAMVALRRKIVEIERDTTLSAAEKALRRQAVMSGAFAEWDSRKVSVIFNPNRAANSLSVFSCESKLKTCRSSSSLDLRA